MAGTTANDWDEVVDVLVVGSGAAAMVAGVIASDRGGKSVLIEKSALYGGSSARSGGGLWIPNNHFMPALGIADSPEDALLYLKGTSRGAVADDRLRAYVDNGPRMLRYLSEHTRAQFDPMPEYPDYYPEVAGWRPGGRSVEALNFHARILGDEFSKMREVAVQALILGRVAMTIKQARLLLCRGPGWLALTAQLMGKYWFDLPWRFMSKRDRNLVMGNALVGSLRRSLMDRGVPVWLKTPARELVVENGRVAGVIAERAGEQLRIRVGRGVILAAGGFESNQAMREKYLPNPTRIEWTCANPENTGDALNLGVAIGAALDLTDYACWGPITVVPGEDRARMLVIEKSLPGGILVNRRGERFVNEALPYVDVVNAIYANHKTGAGCVPAYLIFDADFRRKYPCGPLLPGSQRPDWSLPKRLKEHYLKKADSLDGLARRLGIDAAGLRKTVAKFNDCARTGTDVEFRRGETVFDRYYGDLTVQPNPCLAPIATPPFYGVEAYPGDLGTMGGLKADAYARVLNSHGDVIPGLYAVGNCAASAVGRTYPGPGSTLGPATTFAYIAARHAMGG
ncbi:MAG: FAD-binding protein [Candidatus Binatia bacterium]